MSCGKHHDVDCRDVLDQVYSYLDAEPTHLDVDKIRQHLDECGPCLREYDLENALKALVRRSCACEPAPDGLRLRIMTRITEVRIEMDG
ncbi:MAG TPA: mycothiol system anti-sigma-R factor [Actinomycetales bacterium]|nr:mycothiol system anti-sigma-R factor [Actinomycetales bacterium]